MAISICHRVDMNIMKIGVTIYCIFVFSVGAMAQQQESISQIPSIASEVVTKSIKKAFSHDYKIDRVPVESGIYLQHMIISYNAHMKHAIMEWLKKELSQGTSYTKELYYLLGQLDNITTSKKAIVMLARAISS